MKKKKKERKKQTCKLAKQKAKIKKVFFETIKNLRIIHTLKTSRIKRI